MPAKGAAKKVEKGLDEFNISLKNSVVPCIAGGAAVMTKFGKIIPCKHQLCYAHGIHLAVSDVLYGKNATVISVVASEEMQNEDSPDLSTKQKILK